VGALFSGVVGGGLFLKADFWQNSLVFHPSFDQHMPFIIHYLPIIASASGIGLAYLLYLYRSEWPALLATQFVGLYKFLFNKWYFDEVYNAVFVVIAKRIGHVFWQRGDLSIIDGYGPDGIAQQALKIASRVSRAQSGYIYHYALVFMLGFAALIAWVWFL